jgi:hypothetical protein
MVDCTGTGKSAFRERKAPLGTDRRRRKTKPDTSRPLFPTKISDGHRFSGCGYKPHFVAGTDPDRLHQVLSCAGDIPTMEALGAACRCAPRMPADGPTRIYFLPVSAGVLTSNRAAFFCHQGGQQHRQDAGGKNTVECSRPPDGSHRCPETLKVSEIEQVSTDQGP